MLAYDCYIADVLFGLTYEYTQPGQRLLDAGIGSGLSAQPFARAGLEIYGMDFSPAMLEICRAKGIACELKEHDLQGAPWPYPAGQFRHVISCGVFHFIPELGAIFAEAARVLAEGGVFAFTVRVPVGASDEQQKPYTCEKIGGFDIFSHASAYIESLLAQHGLARCKTQRCFVGPEQFTVWVARRAGQGGICA